jgi:hypothetical protein
VASGKLDASIMMSPGALSDKGSGHCCVSRPNRSGRLYFAPGRCRQPWRLVLSLRCRP